MVPRGALGLLRLPDVTRVHVRALRNCARECGSPWPAIPLTREKELHSRYVDLLTLEPSVASHTLDGDVKVRLGKVEDNERTDWREAQALFPGTGYAGW